MTSTEIALIKIVKTVKSCNDLIQLNNTRKWFANYLFTIDITQVLDEVILIQTFIRLKNDELILKFHLN